jgi:peptide/nickel transport system substrate-binding protein
VDEIEVPADAWYDWDAAAQKFITVGEKFPGGTTAKRKSVVHYPESLYDVPLHDGSKISIGDFILGMILTFDQAKPESPIYDEAAVPGYQSFMASFKGVRIVSTNPLVIETYSDVYTLDAELNVSTWFPYYDQGPGFWHTLALGILAESNKELAFSKDKSALVKVEWMDYTKGPSLPILVKYLDEALATGYIPYAPTMGEYVSAAEAEARYTNLKAWYEKMGHLWVASGPFYLDKVFPTEKQIVLKRFENYPFAADRFQFLVK